MKLVGCLVSLLSVSAATAQINISPNTVVEGGSSSIVVSGAIANRSDKTNLGNATVVLAATAGTPAISTNTTNAISIGKLEISSKVDYTVNGLWIVNRDFVFTSGKLVTANSSKLVYSGTPDISGNANSYVQGNLFVQGNAGQRTFPVGDLRGYAPVVLQQIADADKNTELGFGVVNADPGFTLGPGVLDYSKTRFWQFTNGNSSSYAGSQIWLSSNDTDSFFSDGKSATVLENDATGTTNDLGASTTSGFFASNKLGSPTGRFYAIGKTDELTIKVHKLITPDGDTKNDVLFIEGIDGAPENEVTILDRWGVQFYKKKNFVNYPDSSLPQQEGVDYSKLAIGNYVVVVQYNERGATKSRKQMITVLK
ncbi:MAG: gliding motility-associated C-terminal domain-containing protein [Flammeovirgaceae bacterium]